MALQKAVIATPLMIPLIVITILFNAYVRQEHFRVAKYLPSRECMKVDRRNGPDFDLSFAKDAYLQEELRQKVRYPEDLTEEMARVLGLIDESEIEYSLTRPYGAC